MTEKKKAVSCYVSSSKEDEAAYYASETYQKRMHQVETNLLKQAAKGEVSDVQVKFPKELGAEHPFDFEKIETTLEKIGIINAGVDKITDAIIGDFTVTVEDKNAQALIDDFVEESSFLSVLRPWVKEGISKGNGYIDTSDIENNNIEVLNANDMYVKRNRKGKILKYTQFLGNKKVMRINTNNVNEFRPDEISHLKINRIPGKP